MGLQRVGHNWATFKFQILCRCSVTKLCPTRQPRGQQHVRFPVLHCLLQFAQTHVHWFSDAIQTSYPLLALSLPALNHSQHQGPFQWAGSSYHVVKVLDPQLQHQSFRWIFRVDFLWDWLVWSPCCPRDSKSLLQHCSLKASVLWHSAFFMVHLSHICMITGRTVGWLLEKL